jgi:hypothetical protein
MTVTFAIAYPVDTQAIRSSGVPKLARMSLSATFTMLMSMTAISAPSIAAIVIQSLLPWMGVCSAMTVSVRPDGDDRAHAGAERNVGRPFEADEHRHALDTFTKLPLALSGGSSANRAPDAPARTLDVPLEVTAAVGVDAHAWPSGPRASRRSGPP